ncbi:hypothetical protein E2C01_098733 [Portunus trituberculatus]|uniref:Uncharacterized protein n=1 Tax=Portunus trituberculatus TaxID=210409 RepID=A0A5B7K3N4_PORTR|nr:hypothetical protein [Portunus trituberculatus]
MTRPQLRPRVDRIKPPRRRQTCQIKAYTGCSSEVMQMERGAGESAALTGTKQNTRSGGKR